MKTIKTVGIALTLLMAIGSAKTAHAFTCQEKLNKKAPITFKPFPLENPKTGQKYAPNEEIEVAPGTKKLAGDFFGQVNDMERKLNAWGYSLRDAGAYSLQEVDTCLALLQSQKSTIEGDLDKNPPKPWDLEARRKELEDKWNAYKENIVSMGELWSKADSDTVKVNLPAPPPFSTPVPQAARVEPKEIFKKRTWSFEEGSKDTFWVKGQANIGLKGSRESTRLDADGKFEAALKGLWEGELASAAASAESGKGIDPNLHLDVRVVGKSVWSPTYKAKPDSTAGKINKFLHGADKYSLAMDEGVDWRFSIGPIPMKARLGFRGEAGLSYGYDIAFTAVGGFAGPFAGADAYAQLGIDLYLVGAGIQGQLVLIKDELTLRGDATVDFVDEPRLSLDLSAKNHIEALSGQFKVYAFVNYLFDTWRGEYTLWSWEGLTNDWEIFHFNYVWTPGGVRAEGDVRAEDVIEVQSQNAELNLVALETMSNNRLYQVGTAAAADLGSPKAAQVLTERARFASASQGIDANLATYMTELRKWSGS
jgi:hypothetical protein